MDKDYVPYSDPRFYSDPGARPVACNTCKHNHRGHRTCDAFPNGIPVEIIKAGTHDTPYEGDNGIRYEPIEKK